MRMQVQSLAPLSGLRIPRCHELWCWWQMWLGSGISVAVVQAGSCSSHSDPAWETPYATGAAPPPKKKKSEKMQEQRKAVKQDQILMVCLVIKQSRTFRSSSRAVDGIFLFFCLFFCIWYFEPHPVSCLRETETPTRRKKLTTC